MITAKTATIRRSINEPTTRIVSLGSNSRWTYAFPVVIHGTEEAALLAAIDFARQYVDDDNIQVEN